MATFIVDCKHCKAKVAAQQHGVAENTGMDQEHGELYGSRLLVGKCPRCTSLIAAHSDQIGFEGVNAEADEWTEPERVFPDPDRTFTSYRVPRSVKNALSEANKTLGAGATTAACVMFGRALEAVCRDKLAVPGATNTKTIMLGKGIKELKAKNIIEQRLYDWSEQLQAFRNIAAHANDEVISREDAEDLQVFVYAIVEYIYDLTDRYEEFKERVAKKKK